MKISRRKFLGASTVLGAGLLAGSTQLVRGDTTEQLECTHLSLPLLKAGSAFRDYRIGFLTDPHLSPFVPDSWLLRALHLLKREAIDLLLLGGDNLLVPKSLISKMFWIQRNERFIQSDAEQLATDILLHFAHLTKEFIPKDGAFSVMGNHEGWIAPLSLIRSLSKDGLQYLINEDVTVEKNGEKLRIIGLDDYWTGIPELPTLPDGPSDSEIRILLAHNPDGVASLLKHTQFNFHLSLSGHTHGGQLCLPNGQGLLYNVYEDRFRSGLVTASRGYHYTSRGIGVVEIPYRIHCPQEVVVITLVEENLSPTVEILM